jgi:hypothetical protein
MLFFRAYAQHQLAHALGFGSAPSFFHFVQNNTFTGPVATARYGRGNVPLAPDPAHFATNTTVYLSDYYVFPLMNPPPQGDFYFTPLDAAAMVDIGWQTYVEPIYPFPGNINGDTSPYDNVVDLNDLNHVLNNFGTTAPEGYASPRTAQNAGGVVDLNDLNLVINNFGNHMSPTTVAVPEPSGAPALAPAALPFLARRPRSGRHC